MNSEDRKAASGQLEVVAGCMFSGKTETLIARLREGQERGLRVGAFKHTIDDRYDPEHLVTHAQDKFPARRIGQADSIVEESDGLDLIAIEEGHFWGRTLLEVVQQLMSQGKQVVIAGIHYDAWGRPFPPMPELMDLADRVTHKYTACRVCGGQARYSQRMIPVGENLMVGGVGDYEPRCARCFEPLADPAPEQE